MRALAVVAASISWATVVCAQPSPSDEGARDPFSHHHLNLRVGAATSDTTGRPAICLEVAPWSRLSVEGCGTGQGFLHDEAGRELAHFRAKWRLVTVEDAFALQAGAGFAELQIGDDDPGFVFGRSDPIEVAGPEAALSVQWLLDLAADFEVVVNATAGLAYVPFAPRLADPLSAWQPFLGMEAGAGW